MFYVAEATGTNEDEPRCEGYKERDTNVVCFALEITEITLLMQFMEIMHMNLNCVYHTIALVVFSFPKKCYL
jgi:hypothetical protein